MLTPGQILLNDALPEDLRDDTRVWTAGAMEDVLKEVAKRYPEQYKEISHKLMQLGRHAVYEEGATVSLEDFANPIADSRAEILGHVREQSAKINAMDIPAKEKSELLETVYSAARNLITDSTYDTALASENPFALQVLSKARGSKGMLASLLSSPGTYSDPQGNTIPFFARHSHSEGMTPAEYFAEAFGARQGVFSTKYATRQAGDLGKQFNQASMRMIVTKDDCGTAYGIPASVSDADTRGAVLAHPVAGYTAGTILSKATLADIREQTGNDEIMVRSPLTCGMGNGVCAHCAGVRESGHLPAIGDHVGLNAASALAERVAQSSLNVKHSGGQSAGGKKVYSGFDMIKNLFQVPQNFPHSATVASVDGTVESVEPAAQGGWDITIGGNKHYVTPDLDVTVKPGDTLEAGDVLSSGVINPAEIVKYKGLGEGRRYFAERATQMFRDSGYAVNKRNMEILTRSVLDSAEVDEPDSGSDYLPGDVVSYSSLAHGYKPRPGAKLTNVDLASGKYLEEPVMHYTIGTRVTPSMAKNLRKFGYESAVVHDREPGFHASMIGLRRLPHSEPDWMAQLGSSYLQKNILQNTHRGAESDLMGGHPVPAIAHGMEIGKAKAWRP